ncbi:MAG TPA: dihydropteroate synthase [Acidiferrobacterales bacterium]|nr:dihydropteroate synthase [Acidiferrobacterales bacterium]
MTPLDCGGRMLDLSRTAIMGILNITPDSFSDGGIFLAHDAAVAHALTMVEEGADIIDVGGESTRPGAQAVSVQEELDRVVPVIEAIACAVPVPISIDTSKPEVMRAAVAAGAGVINDVRALRATGAVETAAALAVPVCLMHMQGEPRSMQQNPAYTNVVGEVRDFLYERIETCIAAGITRDRLIIDPGFGFGKSVVHNLELLRRLSELRALGAPILAGLSRKSMIGALLGLPMAQRLQASVALALIAVQNGAGMLRVHDVRATREAIRMFEAVYPRTGE